MHIIMIMWIGLLCLVALVGGQENPDLDEAEGSGAGDDDEYATTNTTYVRFNYTGQRARWSVPAGISEVRPSESRAYALGRPHPLRTPPLRLSCWLTRLTTRSCMSWAGSHR